MSFENPLDSTDICSYVSILDFNSRVDCNQFLVFQQNIRSFNKNYDEFSVFLNNLATDIDVIVFTETWFTDSFNCDIHSEKNRAQGDTVT